jgi:pimeloyl-ACP methyl ester carboxylesterase
MAGPRLVERTTAVGARPVRYLTGEPDGDGTGALPLVAVHGLGESAADWGPALTRLAALRRVYALDLPGSDGRPAPAAGPTIETYATLLGELLDALGLDQVVLAGHSLGGAEVIELARARSDRVAGLVLVASAGLGRAVSPVLVSLSLPGAGEAAMAWSRTRSGAAHRAAFRAAQQFARPWAAPAFWLAEQRRLARLPGFMETTLGALRDQIGPAGQRRILTGSLPGLEPPALVVWGTADQIVPPAQGRKAASLLPRGTLAVLPLAGHLPHVERPEAFAGAVGGFLRTVDRRV